MKQLKRYEVEWSLTESEAKDRKTVDEMSANYWNVALVRFADQLCHDDLRPPLHVVYTMHEYRLKSGLKLLFLATVYRPFQRPTTPGVKTK